MKDYLTKVSNFVSSRNASLILGFLGLYLVSTGISVVVFSYILKKPQLAAPRVKQTRSKINLDLPKTEACPINGAKYTKAEREIWETRRPITVMLENHVDSRPPSGLSKADVVYEAVAEGGITRFLSVFNCGASAEDLRIGPIRSVRVYFVDWASEYGDMPLFVHSGGANNICGNCPGGVKSKGQVAPEVDAFRLLSTIGWRVGLGNALDAGTNIGFPVVWRDYERIPGAATEHTFMGSTDKLFEEGAKRGFGYNDSKGVPWTKSFVPWKFIDDKPQTPSASNISFGFWNNKPDYDVEWRYDNGSNSYKRFNGGKEHIDMDSKTQLSAKNVVIQFTKETGPVDKEGHMFYTTTGTGKALVFANGGVTEGTWNKDSRTSRTKFLDKAGREIAYVRGPIWIEIVPAGNEVKY